MSDDLEEHALTKVEHDEQVMLLAIEATREEAARIRAQSVRRAEVDVLDRKATAAAIITLLSHHVIEFEVLRDDEREKLGIAKETRSNLREILDKILNI